MNWSRVLGCLVFLAACAAEPVERPKPPEVPVSHALEPSPDDARRYVDAGLRFYARHAYAEAAAAFEAAYLRAPEPSLLLARAQALRLAGACERARPLYDRFLRETSDPISEAAIVRLADECHARIVRR